MRPQKKESLAAERLERVHAAAKEKLNTEEERLDYDIGRSLGELETALTITEAARKAGRPFSESDPIEADAILENIYQQLETDQLKLAQANCLLDSLKSQYKENPAPSPPTHSLRRKRKTTRRSA
jgi:hypothetical protein